MLAAQLSNVGFAPARCSESGRTPTFFRFRRQMTNTIQTDIEARLAEAEPDVEVLLAEMLGGGRVRVFIDHPKGVSLELCERVTRALAPLRAQHALEVSSPGTERPLTKPEHFRRYVGRRARIRTRDALHSPETAQTRRSVTGELVGASDNDVTVAAPEGVVSIPYAEIKRSNLVGG
jgi:ribosome maturation factor RimP